MKNLFRFLLFSLLTMHVALAQQVPYDLRLHKYLCEVYPSFGKKTSAPEADQLVWGRTVDQKPTHTIYWTWNELEKSWEKSHQEWLIYNPDHQLISILDQSWTGDEWKDETKTTFVYTDHKDLLLFQFESWEFGSWVLYSRYVYNYDQDNRLTVFTAQDWIHDQWDDRYRRLYAYHDQTGATCITTQNMLNGKWENQYRDVQYVNDQEEVIMETHELFYNGQWSCDSRCKNDYSPHGQLTCILDQVSEEQEWSDAMSTVLTYTTDGKIKSRISHRFIPLTWYDDFATQFQYDEKLNEVENSNWILEDTTWDVQSRNILAYDEQNRTISLLSQTYNDYWLNKEYIENEYELASVLHPADFSADLVVYPNPVNEEVHLQIPEASKGEYDLLLSTVDGTNKLKEKWNSLDAGSISMSSLPAGGYILQIRNQDHSAVKLFFKQ